MEGIEIRRATKADKAAVVGISGGIYDGLDYIADYYDDVFLEDPSITPYVAVCNGEIVAFLAIHVVDGGQTVISRAGRVKPSLARRGIYRELKRHAVQESGASFNAFTAINSNPAIRSKAFKTVMSRSLTRYNFTIQEHILPENAKDVAETPLKVLNLSNLQQYFTTPEYGRYLFPDNRIIVNWVPYQLIESNVTHVLREDNRCQRLTDVRSDNGDICGIITFCKLYKGINGANVCILDIYGKDDESLERHLRSHLRFINQKTSGKVMMLVITEDELVNSLEKCLDQRFQLNKTLWRFGEGSDVINQQILLAAD